MEPIIIDDAVDDVILERLEEIAYHRDQPWYLTRTADETEEHSSFSFFVYDFSVPQGEIPSLAIKQACQKANVSIGELLRIRWGLILRDNTIKVSHPHVDDYINKHMGAILYLNDCDGDTIFYDRKFNPNLDESIIVDEELPIKIKVTPKRNRVVIFEGWTYHSSTTPYEHQLRYNINFNFTGE